MTLPNGLFSFQEPEVFIKTVDVMSNNIPFDQKFFSNEYKGLREAWVAGKFALLFNCRVKLEIEQASESDFELLLNEENHIFQLVEADKDDRKRHDECKETGNLKQLQIIGEEFIKKVKGK